MEGTGSTQGNRMPAAPHRRLRTALAVALALCTGACSESAPTTPRDRPESPAPTTPPDRPETPAPSPPTISPLDLAGASDIAADDLNARYATFLGSPVDSRYVFYDDSTFGLQVSTVAYGSFEYTGRFTRAESGIAFAFDGSSIAYPWVASGTLVGDSLSVAYNDLMQHSDFIDGVYVRTR